MSVENLFSLKSFKIIFLLLLVDASIEFEALKAFRDQDLSSILSKDNNNNASTYELVKLNFSPASKNLRTSKNRYLSFTAFGQQYRIELKPRDNILVGKNTPIWHVELNPRNSSQIKYTPLINVLDNLNGIYQDPTNMVSLIESKVQENDKIYYEGVIDKNLAISPLPSNLMSNNSDADARDHIVYKILRPETTFNIPMVNTTKKNKKKNQLRPYPLPTLYPEILIVVDGSLYNQFDNQPHLAMNYLLPFWNGVDLRYSFLKSPEVKLNIAGVILAKEEMALHFLQNNLDNTGRILAKEALIDAGKYFNSSAQFIKSKDIVVIMTKRDICSFKNSRHCKSSTLGKAFTGKACSKIKNTAIFEDNGGYGGIISATHEIGHLLSLPHDGVDEAAHCPSKDGYIMASASFRYNSSYQNNFLWSSCSKKILKQFSSLTDSNCLENKPKNFGTLLSHTLPGKVLTLEEQCLARGGKPCIFNATVCWKLHCTKSMTNLDCVGKAPAAEGSTCGDNLHCLNGKCVADNLITLDNYLKSYKIHNIKN